jgi:hypothetical protein
VSVCELKKLYDVWFNQDNKDLVKKHEQDLEMALGGALYIMLENHVRS